jgi:hypothetical protein
MAKPRGDSATGKHTAMTKMNRSFMLTKYLMKMPPLSKIFLNIWVN